MPVTILVLGLVAVGAWTDLRRRKIYNWTTYPGILFALVCGATGDLLVWLEAVEEARLRAWGWISLGESLVGLLLCGLPLVFCFVMFRLGGGDVKLLTMVGAMVGPQQGLEVMLWTFVLGGCAALIVLLWRVGPLRLLTWTLRQVVWSLRLGRWSPLSPEERAELQAPFFLAPWAWAAVAIVRFELLS
jgi:prepilin peptidase CpaA